MSFEQWLEENADFVRRTQDRCLMGHAEGGVYWWDTRVDLECSSCGAKPGQEHWGCNDRIVSDYPLCDCNAQTLYAKAMG
jgi:hypothetical protein